MNRVITNLKTTMGRVGDTTIVVNPGLQPGEPNTHCFSLGEASRGKVNAPLVIIPVCFLAQDFAGGKAYAFGAVAVSYFCKNISRDID